MIEKTIDYKDKDFSKHLKGLGLSKEEIKYILGENKRKKFEDGGESGGPGDSGPGGSDDGSSSGVGSGEGESTGDANDQGGTVGPGDTSSVGPSDTGFGIGPDATTEAAQSVAQSISADNISTQAQADQEDAETAAAAANAGVMSTISNVVKNAIQNAINNPVSTVVGALKGTPAGFAVNALGQAISSFGRGVTGPSDDTQETESVQSGPSQSPSGGDGGIGTMQAYAPLYNSSETSGDSTMDAYIRRLRINLGLPV